MNVDGSRGVAADLAFGADVDYLGWLAAGLLAAGALLLAGSAVLVYFGARQGRTRAAPPRFPRPRRSRRITRRPAAARAPSRRIRWPWTGSWTRG